jgi:Rab5 GDP/GTP exchange factor
MPLLIYVVLHSNPEHLVSNVQYILRFRNQDKLGGEAGYYLSSLVSIPSRPAPPRRGKLTPASW